MEYNYKSEELEISVEKVNDDEKKIMISFVNYKDGIIFVQKLWDHEAKIIVDMLQKALELEKEV